MSIYSLSQLKGSFMGMHSGSMLMMDCERMMATATGRFRPERPRQEPLPLAMAKALQRARIPQPERPWQEPLPLAMAKALRRARIPQLERPRQEPLPLAMAKMPWRVPPWLQACVETADGTWDVAQVSQAHH